MESRHSRAICLIGMGRIGEGFAEFEIRNDQRFRAYVHHMTKAPLWKGEPLEGKRILVVAEQGLGDEFMFANILPDLQDAVGPDGKLDIAVDPRLIALFQRSFPNADVGRYDDRTLIDKDGNKSLRFIPFSVDKGEPAAVLPQGTRRLSAQIVPRRGSRARRGLSRAARKLRRRPQGRDLLAFDDAGRQARQVLERARRLGPDPEDARRDLRQPAIRRLRR
jgi:hypothetical protein